MDKFEKKTVCEYCEKEMKAEQRNKRFCSTKCRVYWNREKNRAKIDFKAQISAVGLSDADPTKIAEKAKVRQESTNTAIKPMQFHEILQLVRRGVENEELEAIIQISKLTPNQRDMIYRKQRG